MITTLVYIKVKHEYIPLFIKACIKNHDQSILETGNLRFDILQHEEIPGEFVLYEAYENEEYAIAHKSTVHYKEWRETVADWMEKPREGVRYKGIRP